MGGRFLRLKGVHHCRPQRQSLNSLRAPLGAQFGTRNPPYFLGIRLKKYLKKPLAEPIRHPRGEIVLRLGRKHLRPQKTEPASRRFHQSETSERVHRLQRIREKLVLVENARHARPAQEILAQDLLPHLAHQLYFGEKPVAADIEQVSLVLDRSGYAPD